MQGTRWLTGAAFTYLLLPWFIFSWGWLRAEVAILSSLMLLLAIRELWESGNETLERISGICKGSLILFAWLILSGIGGFAFQNADHNWRNAVLRDLINYPWPVRYRLSESSDTHLLAYYIGFWLPSALIGKLLGWKAANIALLIWSFGGILIGALLISLHTRQALWKTSLLLAFFSGADVVGVALTRQLSDLLWPPTRHIEWWYERQYSSFTTQLFWVYNQAIPAWIGTLLIHSASKLKFALLAWALTLFFAPLPAAGLLPFALTKIIPIIRQISSAEHKPQLSLPPSLLLSGMVLVTASLYLSTNSAGRILKLSSPPVGTLLFFCLLEGGLIWLLMTRMYYRDPNHYVIGLLLFTLPFVQIGYEKDFTMRASIPNSTTSDG